MVDQGDGDEDPVASLATGRVPVPCGPVLVLPSQSTVPSVRVKFSHGARRPLETPPFKNSISIPCRSFSPPLLRLIKISRWDYQSRSDMCEPLAAASAVIAL